MRKSFALELHGEPSEFAAEHDHYATLRKFNRFSIGIAELFCNCSSQSSARQIG